MFPLIPRIGVGGRGLCHRAEVGWGRALENAGAAVWHLVVDGVWGFPLNIHRVLLVGFCGVGRAPWPPFSWVDAPAGSPDGYSGARRLHGGDMAVRLLGGEHVTRGLSASLLEVKGLRAIISCHFVPSCYLLGAQEETPPYLSPRCLCVGIDASRVGRTLSLTPWRQPV